MADGKERTPMLSVFCSPSRSTQGKNATASLGSELVGLGTAWANAHRRRAFGQSVHVDVTGRFSQVEQERGLTGGHERFASEVVRWEQAIGGELRAA
jgi:hypothetical protein